MDLKTELSSNQTILLVIPGIEYNEILADTMKKLSGNICYVTSNKTYDALKEIFEKNKIDLSNVVFIDSISKTIKKVSDKSENVYYVSSPGALTELSLVINKFLGHEFDYLIFDSLTNLSVYQSQKICIKFITDLINKIKKTKTKAVLYAIESKENDSTIAKVSTFVDKVVKAEQNVNLFKKI